MKTNLILILSGITVLFATAIVYSLHINHTEKLLPLNPPERKNTMVPSGLKWQSGDLVFRHGKGILSELLLQFNVSEKKFSHVGILMIEDHVPYVYHAIGGEENRSNKLRKESLASFCNPSIAEYSAIYNSGLSPSQRNSLMAMVNQDYEKGLEFDLFFDLATDDKMYCSEWVFKTWQKLLGNSNYISLSAIGGRMYVACDNIYRNSNCKLIISL